MDVLMYLFLAALLIPANIFMIKWQKSGKLPLWSSGLLLAILGVVIGFAVGAILIAGDSGQGGGLMAAFIGLVIVGNGIVHLLIGLALTIGKQYGNKNTQV
ncbi:UNVERIFIED_CONTAM: inner-membrane translocator [Halobacillus marinus]|uniref:hypothetical protein n=1 Tax=Halobacillus sp. BAB-2008 TaxID=1246484 RepID=UPI0002A4D347|nr:hypothetical protein [Halobacillus sp. BAB-2008]ELK46794.1 inner-membrane translocator [Halobacillus sp. BAB-2008]